MISWQYLTTANTGGYTIFNSATYDNPGTFEGEFSSSSGSTNRYGYTYNYGQTTTGAYPAEGNNGGTLTISPYGQTFLGTSTSSVTSGGSYNRGTSTTVSYYNTTTDTVTSTFSASYFTSTESGGSSYVTKTTSSRTDVAQTTVSVASTSRAVTTVTASQLYVDTVGVSCFLAEENEVLWYPTATALGIYAMTDAFASVGAGGYIELSNNLTYNEVAGVITNSTSVLITNALTTTNLPDYISVTNSSTTYSAQYTDTLHGGITTTTGQIYRYSTSNHSGGVGYVNTTSNVTIAGTGNGTCSYSAWSLVQVSFRTSVGLLQAGTQIGYGSSLGAVYETYEATYIPSESCDSISALAYVEGPGGYTSAAFTDGGGVTAYEQCTYAQTSLGAVQFNLFQGQATVGLKQPNIGWRVPGDSSLYASIEGMDTNQFAKTDGSYPAVSESTGEYYFYSSATKYTQTYPWQTVPVPYPLPQQWVDSNSVSYNASWDGATVSLTTRHSTISGSQVVVWAGADPVTETLFKTMNGYNFEEGLTNVFCGSGTYPDLTAPNSIFYGAGAYAQSTATLLVTDYASTTITKADFVRPLYAARLVPYPAYLQGREVAVDVRTQYNQ